MAEVSKKRNTCHNCGSTDHYSNKCPKGKKKVYAIEKVPDKESPTESSESDSMADANREQSYYDQDPREEYLIEYQEETQIEIQDTSNKSFCKHTQDSQTCLVRPTKGMACLHGTATKITVCIDNAQHSLIIDSGACFSIVSRTYMDHYIPNWDKQLFIIKAKKFKSASGKKKSIGKINKEIIIPHRKANIGLNPEFFVLEDAHIQGVLLGTDYQRMYGIDIQNKFSIGEEPLGKFRGHDIELYLDVERPYPPILRRPPYPESLEAKQEIGKHVNELLEMDVIRKIGHNEIVEITTPVLITWHDGKYILCGDFRPLNNYTKADRYPIPRIPHATERLAKTKYITKMDCMKGFK
ncbi:hypothetical protein O181_023325 [Austropuccinia psidii MF-1]|uniref:CCHC-type domain-containing protein n=1 Tax=Austropuccinia psidii MF-1 TaxID=1389203 RepID=A0A9Q3GYZ4_9BASI|nr:hypothetical protein [Austropuccinia psidii MF-1]